MVEMSLSGQENSAFDNLREGTAQENRPNENDTDEMIFEACDVAVNQLNNMDLENIPMELLNVFEGKLCLSIVAQCYMQ